MYILNEYMGPYGFKSPETQLRALPGKNLGAEGRVGFGVEGFDKGSTYLYMCIYICVCVYVYTHIHSFLYGAPLRAP